MESKSRAESRSAGQDRKDAPTAPKAEGVASCQFTGKGKWQTLWLSLDAERPELTFRAGGQFGVVMRTADLAGCVVSRPKHVRKGHEMAIRLDLVSEDSQGDTKYVLALETMDEFFKWKTKLSGYEGETGATGTADAQPGGATAPKLASSDDLRKSLPPGFAPRAKPIAM